MMGLDTAVISFHT